MLIISFCIRNIVITINILNLINATLFVLTYVRNKIKSSTTIAITL